MIVYIDRMPRSIALTESELRSLAAAYAEGLSIRALASLRGMSYGTTHKSLHAAAASGLVSVRARGSRSVVNER